jgi:hypothetical protein
VAVFSRRRRRRTTSRVSSGTFRSFKEFLRPEVLDQVAAQSPGALGFLAFHPAIDKPITDYVQAGSMASDSRSRVLVFFTTDSRVSAPTHSDDPTISLGRRPSQGLRCRAVFTQPTR